MNAQRNEQQHERNTGDNVGVEHRDVGDAHADGFHFPVHAVDAHGCHGADDGGDGCGQESDEQRIV